MIIKVCGMREANNIRMIEKLGAGMMGFIFYPESPRYVNELPSYLPQTAKRVGVFVNENKENILTIADRFSLDYIQLHGNESAEYCLSLKNKGLKIIKTFSISNANDLIQITEYDNSCDLYLFDTKSDKYGGSGKQFNWDLLNHYHEQTPFLLGGGITPESASSLKMLKHPQLAGYDLNSKFESSPGIKNPTLLERLLNELNLL